MTKARRGVRLGLRRRTTDERTSRSDHGDHENQRMPAVSGMEPAGQLRQGGGTSCRTESSRVRRRHRSAGGLPQTRSSSGRIPDPDDGSARESTHSGGHPNASARRSNDSTCPAAGELAHGAVAASADSRAADMVAAPEPVRRWRRSGPTPRRRRSFASLPSSLPSRNEG